MFRNFWLMTLLINVGFYLLLYPQLPDESLELSFLTQVPGLLVITLGMLAWFAKATTTPHPGGR